MEAHTDARILQDALNRRENGVVLQDVSWETYEGLLLALGNDHPSLRLTYLNGLLEIMTTSQRHERIKKLIARLIELWALEHDLRFDGYGGATFRKREAARGLEPGECYVLRDIRDVDAPDLAIEVVETHGSIDKMSVYAGLGVREVWVWEANELHVHVLRDGVYDLMESSELLPTLDVAEFANFVREGEGDQTATVRRYRARIRGEK